MSVVYYQFIKQFLVYGIDFINYYDYNIVSKEKYL